MDAKGLYLVKTLSRTNRKDYENYVVNAIWNRVNDPRLIPVTQQYVRDEEGNRYFIDLYFPQLKIGIECKEGYHDSQEQRARDQMREATIFDVIKQIHASHYTSLEVRVGMSEDRAQTISYTEMEDQINDCVRMIRERLQTEPIRDEWASLFMRPEDYFKGKTEINIYDDIAFRSNQDIYNVIFGENYKGSLQNVGTTWDKLYTQHGYNVKIVPWLPKLTVKNKPTSKGYCNVLSSDGTEIYEYNVDPSVNMQRKAENRYFGERRVTFTGMKNRITGQNEYRFIGIFEGERYDGNGILTYKRICEKFDIIQHNKGGTP